jgi:hypothetical protein
MSTPGYPQPPAGYPPPGQHPRPISRIKPLILGLVVGLVIGAGVLGLVWTVSVPDGAKADAEAVCGILERTDLPDKDVPMEELRRWSAADVGPSLAKEDPDLKALGDALEKVYVSIRTLDRAEMESATAEVKEQCDDL